jgi:uncharacterized integral membrane protein (TIGR00698 family)
VTTLVRRSPATRTAASALPGLAVTAAGAAAAFAVAHALPEVNPSTVAVVLGSLLTHSRLHRPVLRPGTALAGKRALRLAVVLLGLQLSLPELARLGGTGLAVVVVTVAVTFFGTRLLGRWLGVPPARSLLVATGFSICGASAVAAMEPVAEGRTEEDVSVAVALVTLCGSLAIVLLPLLRVPLGLDVTEFGSWAGASVHDVGQTVATAQRVPGALTTAVVVKLTRVVLLAPLVAGVSLTRRTAAAADVRRPPPVPLFVAGFLAAVAVASTGLLPHAVLKDAATVQSGLLVAALFGLGTGIHVPTLVRTGKRSLALGLISWLLVAGVAYAGVRVAAP